MTLSLTHSLTHSLRTLLIDIQKAAKEWTLRLVTFETFDQSDEETWPDQQKDNDKDKYKDKHNDRDKYI